MTTSRMRLAALPFLLVVLAFHASCVGGTTTPLQMAKAQGYSCEEHQVTTADGYILTMSRLPHPGRPVVYIANQLAGSAAAYLLLGKGIALPYALHDMGFDVWLGNFRGTPLSRKHTKLSSSDDRFWKFSWHENGALDNPAMMEYILKQTRQSSLVYMGHSMGATTFFVTMSERPDLAKKVRAAFLFAPPVFMTHTMDPMLQLMRQIATQTEEAAEKFHLYGKLIELFQRVLKEACPKVASACHVDPKKLNTLKNGVSLGQLIHYAQLVSAKTPTFRKYDYGSAAKNKQHYGTAVPPEYKLKNANAPVYIYNGPADATCTQKDVVLLRDRLPNVKRFFFSADKAFAHDSFLFDKKVMTAVWNQVLQDVKPYLSPPTSG